MSKITKKFDFFYGKKNFILSIVLCLMSLADLTYSQEPEKKDRVVGEVTVEAVKANVEPQYVKLRKLSDESGLFTGEYAVVKNLTLKRDAATFTLISGEIYFLKPVDGKTHGAVFFGEGEVLLTPPVEAEKKMLNFFVGAEDFREQFTKLTFFFTDETYNEIKNSSSAQISTNGSQASKAESAYKEKESLLRNEFRYNITTRILMDKYAPRRPGFLTLFIEGKKYDKLVYQIDPLGIEEVSPEQVAMINYSRTDFGIWSAFHLEQQYKNGTANSWQDRRLFDITDHKINAVIRGTRIIATDVETIVPRAAGQRVLPFSLFPNLRVKRVLNEKGETIDFVQEDKDKDGSLAVILPVAQPAGKPFKLTFEYDGDGAIIDRGGGNFILLPRSTWYPNNGGTQFGDRATFDMTLEFPKKYTMIGVGELVEPETVNEDSKTARWSTKGIEMAVAAFNFGNFVKKEFTDEQTGYLLEVFANKELPSELKNFQRMAQQAEVDGMVTETTLGSVSTISMANNVLVQAQNSTRIYDNYFGKLPHKRIAMTQQPATNFGQAWATLVFMPYTAYIDETLRVQLFGLRGGTNGFWTEVAAHEVAHQWWGHAVGWTSYHDQWMSEGFAEFSTSLYLQYVRNDIDKFIKYWEGQRKQITQATPATKDKKPYTVGPVTQGYRLNTARTGSIAQNLIYPKGAFIIHMLRMMMYDKKEGDQKFRLMMQDFIKSHYNKDVSTEDFKKIVEKHMTPKMNVDKNGKMDWFFDQWIYGTEVPAYRMEYNVNKSTGKTILNAKITQSDVSNNFVMLVPVYADFGKGWVLLGSATIVGNSTVDLGNIELPQTPKKVAICALQDVLTTKIENIGK